MKPKLIDADAFKKSVLTDFWEHYTQCHDTDQTSLMDMVMDNLDEQPTIDAVPVVRCRDCIGKSTWYKNESSDEFYICGMSGMYIVKDTDYCSYGERKENNA